MPSSGETNGSRFNNNLKVCKYIWQIGCFIFTIYTSRSDLKLPFFAISKEREQNFEIKNLIPITIWLEENPLIKEKMIKFCKDRGTLYIPNELTYFYQVINKELRKKLFFF